MTVRKGLSGGSYRPLSPEQIKQIDETTFRVLSEVGVQVNYPEARELFARAGAQVDPGEFGGEDPRGPGPGADQPRALGDNPSAAGRPTAATT